MRNRITGTITWKPDDGSDSEVIEFNGHPGYLNTMLIALKIHTKKNHDYCGGNISENDHPLANFIGVKEYGINTETGFIVRIYDKIQRFKTWAKGIELKVASEGIHAIATDLINYFALLSGWIQEKSNTFITEKDV